MKTKGIGIVRSYQSQALRFLFTMFSEPLKFYSKTEGYKTEEENQKNLLWFFLVNNLNVNQRIFELVEYNFGRIVNNKEVEGVSEVGVSFKVKFSPTCLAYLKDEGLIQGALIREEEFTIRILMFGDCGEWNVKEVVFDLTSEQCSYYLQETSHLVFKLF